MIVLVRWCCNANCHSVGRVPSSYPRGVRRPTALLWFYPIPFLFVVSVCPGSLGSIDPVQTPISLDKGHIVSYISAKCETKQMYVVI